MFSTLRQLYPKGRRYPFDETCARIVGLLELFGWSGVDEVNVSHEVGQDHTHVGTIRYGEQCTLVFECNGDTITLASIAIPDKKLENLSNPAKMRLWLDADSEAPTIYRASWRGRGRGANEPPLEGGIPPYLLRRGTGTGSKQGVRTAAVLQEFNAYLEDSLLAHILRRPLSAFCFGTEADVRQISGIADNAALELSGYRPVQDRPIETDNTIPEAAHEHMRWCGFGHPGESTPLRRLEIPQVYRDPRRDTYLLVLWPSQWRGVYIADHEPYTQLQSELHQLRDRLTNADVARMEQARARTMVPITEYTGGYKKPVILIDRDLASNEVEVVSGPWPMCGMFYMIIDEAQREAEFGELLREFFRARREHEEQGGRNLGKQKDLALSKAVAYLRQKPWLCDALADIAAEYYGGRRDKLDDAGCAVLNALYAVQEFGLYQL